ncbi:MAG: hypothetical protein DMG80_11140 [Acidobacteria bacterium]|nr:MAG: hypothetical protein DMG80_11140 [Acidobacteriota bacterium]
MKNVFLAALVSMLAISAAANTATIGSKTPAKGPVTKTNKNAQKKNIHTVSKCKHSAGESARIGQNESGAASVARDMRDDNRGRVTSIHKIQPPHQQPHLSKAVNRKGQSVVVHSKSTKNVAAPHAQQHTAELKTGQLTSRHAAHLETKEAALHHPIHSDREPDSPKQAPETAPQNNGTNQIHLKKHNARMF